MTADNPTRVSGAAQQVKTRHLAASEQKAMDAAVRKSFKVSAVEAAERAVIDAAVEWHKCSDVRGDIETRTILHEAVKRLRAAREPKP